MIGDVSYDKRTRAAPEAQRREANAGRLRRMRQDLRKRDNAMTKKVDCLIEVAKKLKEARTLGEACSDRALLYFIDMTIVHVCDSLRSRPDSRGMAEPLLNLGQASL